MRLSTTNHLDFGMPFVTIIPLSGRGFPKTASLGHEARDGEFSGFLAEMHFPAQIS